MPEVKDLADIPAVDISDGKEIAGVQKKLLIGPQDGAPTFAMRLFSVAPGGHTPTHEHPYEHGVLVLKGRGEVLTAQGPKPIGPGTVVFVKPRELHGFRNTGTEPLEFLCVVPVDVER